MEEPYTFPTPAIRETVSEISCTSFDGLDDATPEFAVKFRFDSVGGRTSISSPVLDVARGEGYALVGGHYSPSAYYPEDSSYSGEQYPGHLILNFEPEEEPSPESYTRDTVLEQLAARTDTVREKDDHSQVQVTVPEDAETFDINESLEILHESPLSVRDVSASEHPRGGGTISIRVESSNERDPYEMTGITDRDEITLHRHEALTIIEALDQYNGDRRTGRIREKIVDTYNLDRFLHYLD